MPFLSVANNSIEFYNTSGTMTYTNTIDGFFNDPTITNVCDPVVIYDSGADKFIFFAQECSGNSSNSNLLICFSQSNDPNGNWWNYKFNGNPANNNTWFDYPKIAVSTNELYVTGNSFSNSGNFQESLLYQIEKNSGYSGGTVNWQYWNNITSSPFTLLPVSSGQQGNYGPGCYLVSTQSSGSSTIDLYDLTNDMSASNETLNHYSISTTTYSPAADGNQAGTSTQLDNGDCRALSGFYQNGIIHFVFHSDYLNGYNGINYNRLNVATLINTSSTFGLSGYEYSYPSVASFATNTTDKSVMIGFGRTGSSIYPEIRVVNCDNSMTWGSSTLVKAGSGYADYTTSGGSAERWGDYTGMCRKHNNLDPTVWMNGMFGTTSNDWESWIAEISGTGGTTNIASTTKSDNFKLYPNPIYQEFKTEFELATNSKISIDIFDIQGKLVLTLFNGDAIAGKNQFTFNKSNLEKGTYFINISSNNQILKNETIIIAN
ncbi:MAG: T9SS type A sorting domain-containing protein [Bacteroidetes bacterium]|nr:T9SS type A sorting domain-containing protein [Bacteroidota bacterium]